VVIYVDLNALDALRSSMLRFVEGARARDLHLVGGRPDVTDPAWDAFLFEHEGARARERAHLDTIEALALRIVKLRAAYEAVGGGRVAAEVGSPGGAGRADPQRPKGEAALPPVAGRQRWVPADDLRAWQAAGRIDWSDCDFDAPHHATDAATWRAIAGGLAAVLAGRPSPMADVARSVYLASHDPIRIERRSGGRVEVIDGRHRLWHAIMAGLPAPVVWGDGSE
jgi:hypothetical protein